MDHFEYIYSHRASDYDCLLSAEDVYFNLRPALQSIISFEAKNILDLGTGTGRIPKMFQRSAQQIIAIDQKMAMLKQNREHWDNHGRSWSILQGDIRNLPIKDNWADITIAGWAIGHMCSWFSSSWKDQINGVLTQMYRTTSSGGYIILIETLGTGSILPKPPTNELANYYNFLEKDWAFHKHITRTDYCFDNTQQAIETLDFFFGQELTNKIVRYHWRRIPEWSGIWWKKV